MTITKLKRLPRSTVKAKNITRLIGSVVAGSGIDVTTVGGNFTVTADPTDFGADGLFSPEMYGAVGDGTTDDTTAFQNMATAVRAAGGGFIRFGQSKTYKVFPSPAVGVSKLIDISNCSGVTIDCNGSILNFPATFTGGRVVWIIYMINCADIEINGLYAQQTATLSPDENNGIVSYYLYNANRQIRINSSYQKYGRACLECVRDAGLSITNRTRGIFVHGQISDQVAYGVTLQKNGDQTVIQGLKGLNNQRVFYAYNVRQIDAQIEDAPGSNGANSVLFGVHTNDAESAVHNTFSDFNLHYTSREQSAQISGFSALQVQQGTATTCAAHVRNLNLNYDIEIITAANTSVVLDMYKQTNVAGNDTTTRGHVLENITVSGSWKGFANNVNLLTWGTYGTWGSETIRNINFKNISSTGSGTGVFQFDGQSVTSCVFDNVICAHDLTFTNDSGGIDFRGNQVYFNGVAPGSLKTSSPTITAAAGTFTSVAASMRHKKIGHLVWFQVTIAITTNGSAATGVICPLPAGLTATGDWTPAGINATTGVGLATYIANGGTTMSIVKASDGSYPGANGTNLIVSGVFEAST